jgi:putative cell wall-binding protein
MRAATTGGHAAASTSRTRTIAGVLAVGVLLALAPLAASTPAAAGPVAADDATYTLCGRVFPDPHAYAPSPAPAPDESPYAKGNASCRAQTFIGHDEALQGLAYLDAREDTGPFIEVIDLANTEDPRIREALDEELGDGFSAGLPQADGSREQVPLTMIKVTAPEGAALVDGVQPVPEAEREHFVFPLSIHGIERAGVEGGLRAIEDLATWGSQEPDRLLLETYDSETIDTTSGQTAQNLRVGEVLMRSVSYFVLANPDGWRRGTDQTAEQLPLDIPVSFQRYNGNGMDMNRDFPAIGYTEHAYTPFSEPETRSFGQSLQALSDNWSGGIDLHGQLVDRAFSFTLIGGSQRPFDKNERVQQFVEEAYADAEIRLSWSALIKPNDAPEDDPRLYGVQYGTIWDTIDYTVTGAFGDWIDSPIGLGADGIDNEMSLSHLSNCGTGTCYIPDAEQLHVDGNKSLIYGMLNFNLQPPPVAFDLGGSDVAFLANPRRLVSDEIRFPEAPEGAVAPDPIEGTGQHPPGGTTTIAEFDVVNGAGTFVGGISSEITYQANAGGQSQGAANGVHIERQLEDGSWERLESYFNQSPVYVQAGARVDENHPVPGRYRVVMDGPAAVSFTHRTEFSTGPVWPEVGQDPYSASNTDLFTALQPFVTNGSLVLVDPRSVLDGSRDLADFDTVIAIDDAFLPGYVDGVGVADAAPERVEASSHANLREDGMAPDESGKNDLGPMGFTEEDLTAMTAAADAFVRDGGNLVLTDDAIRAVEWLGYTDAGSVRQKEVYAGHVSFVVDGAETYDHPLAAGIDRPGAAEGSNSRRQTTEPVPIGYCVDSGACGADEETSPQWFVDRAAWESAGGVPVGGDGTDEASDTRTSLGELPVGDGVVRILGSLAPFPTTEFGHPFGLSSYAVTDSGYVLLRNLVQHENPSQSADPDLSDDELDPILRPGTSAVGRTEVELPFEVVRYAGDGRVQTAAEVARSRFSPREGLDAFVATAGTFPDALAGGPAAALRTSPILLTDRDALPAATRAELERLAPDTIYVLGGEAAVSAAVEEELRDLAQVEVVRLGGDDRFQTAATVTEAFYPAAGTVYVATGGDFPDTLAAGPAAHVDGAPVLLVQRDAIPASTAAELERLQPDRIVVVGGPATISEAVEDDLGEYAADVERVAGPDRLATALAVSRASFGPGAGAVYLATGANFPDGLAGTPAAAGEGAPVLLVGDELTDAVTAEIERLEVRRVVILGGEAAVSADVEQALRDRYVEDAEG